MPKVFQIGVTDINNKKINIVDEIEIVSGKGIKGDRYFHDYNDVRCQITLIEKENIDYYNKKKGTSIPYIEVCVVKFYNLEKFKLIKRLK